MLTIEELASALRVSTRRVADLQTQVKQLQDTLALQKRSYEREIELEVAAERERCAKLRKVAGQVLRDMRAQGVLIEWQTLLDEALDQGSR